MLINNQNLITPRPPLNFNNPNQSDRLINGVKRLNDRMVDTDEVINAVKQQKDDFSDLCSNRPSPLRVKLSPDIDRYHLIKNCYKLSKTRFSSISISPDLTLVEQQNFQITREIFYKKEYNRLGALIKKEICNFKANNWKDFCDNLNNHRVSDSKLWAKLKSVGNSEEIKHPTIPKLKINNNISKNPKDIADTFAKSFGKVFVDSEEPEFDNVFKEKVEEQFEDLQRD
ncbi:unnamed protein product [Brachionus calyciflorus]|uniref:Uncharacterized protein n=1 Tax=Brachionus calyciflorus TaxID=104777 RepID=A0A814GQ78_9BILA|nr:unnamed protein product [Brachionus calyciflorus]